MTKDKLYALTIPTKTHFGYRGLYEAKRDGKYSFTPTNKHGNEKGGNQTTI